MFIKKLIEAVELITEAVPVKWKEHNHKPMDGYTDVCRRTANQSVRGTFHASIEMNPKILTKAQV